MICNNIFIKSFIILQCSPQTPGSNIDDFNIGEMFFKAFIIAIVIVFIGMWIVRKAELKSKRKESERAVRGVRNDLADIKKILEETKNEREALQKEKEAFRIEKMTLKNETKDNNKDNFKSSSRSSGILNKIRAEIEDEKRKKDNWIP